MFLSLFYIRFITIDTLAAVLVLVNWFVLFSSCFQLSLRNVNSMHECVCVESCLIFRFGCSYMQVSESSTNWLYDASLIIMVSLVAWVCRCVCGNRDTDVRIWFQVRFVKICKVIWVFFGCFFGLALQMWLFSTKWEM